MKHTVESVYNHNYVHTFGNIHMTGTKTGDATVLNVRGWGYLTGNGALKIDMDEAAKIQDGFAELVVELLNKHFDDINHEKAYIQEGVRLNDPNEGR